jgi:DNA replication protein DnaC
LFNVVAQRYERRSLAVTSNLEFSAWPEVLGDARMTAALVDRLTHRCHVLVMNWESYRFRESHQAATSRPRRRPKTNATPSDDSVQNDGGEKA